MNFSGSNVAPWKRSLELRFGRRESSCEQKQVWRGNYSSLMIFVVSCEVFDQVVEEEESLSVPLCLTR